MTQIRTLSCLLVLATPLSAIAQQPTDTALTRALREIVQPAQASECALTGAGGAAIEQLASAAQFTVLGEAHGVNHVPKFASALFCALAKNAGYKHLAIEVSPPIARQLNVHAQSTDGAKAIQGFGERYYPGAPFYMLREEAELLAAAVRARGGAKDVLWGLDYDVQPEGYLIQRLVELASPSAKPVALRLQSVADSMYAAALKIGNPGAVYAFAGAPALVADVRRAMKPVKGSEADEHLRILETTLAINGLWLARQAYESNVSRSQNLVQNFVDHYRRAARTAAVPPKAMVKLGASHSYRGRSLVNTFDVGSVVPEIAALNGAKSASILLVGGKGSQDALFDVRTFGYAPVPNAYAGTPWIRPFFAVSDSTGWSVFDLRKLRGPAYTGQLGTLNAVATQTIYAFDFLVILGGSGPSTPFDLKRPAWAVK